VILTEAFLGGNVLYWNTGTEGDVPKDHLRKCGVCKQETMEKRVNGF
jgi:hypothetical protein